MRKRTSIIWTISKAKLEHLIKTNITFSGTLRELGINPNTSGSRLRALKERLKEDKINYSHISLGVFSNMNRRFPKKSKPLEEVMVKNSTYSRATLKKRLLRDGILENKCDICRQLPSHNNIKLVMVIDHINGIRDDNRLKNLRLLCPNCNSQQSTFAGKGNKKSLHKCKYCDNVVSRRSKTGLCKNCYPKYYICKKDSL